jgi:hypothetical protein
MAKKIPLRQKSGKGSGDFSLPGETRFPAGGGNGFPQPAGGGGAENRAGNFFQFRNRRFQQGKTVIGPAA